MASDMGAAKARAMKNDAGGFDVDDFVSKLITYMGGRKGGLNKSPEGSEDNDSQEEDEDDGDSPLDWEKIARLALAKSHRVPVMDLMSVLLCLNRNYITLMSFQARAIVNRAKTTEESEQA